MLFELRSSLCHCLTAVASSLSVSALVRLDVFALLYVMWRCECISKKRQQQQRIKIRFVLDFVCRPIPSCATETDCFWMVHVGAYGGWRIGYYPIVFVCCTTYNVRCDWRRHRQRQRQRCWCWREITQFQRSWLERVAAVLVIVVVAVVRSLVMIFIWQSNSTIHTSIRHCL